MILKALSKISWHCGFQLVDRIVYWIVFTDKEVIKFIFDQIDKNKDGYITFEEYRDYFSDDRNYFEWFNILNAGVVKIPFPSISSKQSFPDQIMLQEQERANAKNTENINNIKEEINNIIDAIQSFLISTKDRRIYCPRNWRTKFFKNDSRKWRYKNST